METKEITQKEIWESFLSDCQEKTFLQSWNWGEFNKATGNKIFRLGVFEKEKFIGLVLVLKITARRGTFLLIQHGPVLIQNCSPEVKTNIVKALLEGLRKIGKEEKADFVRIASILEKNEGNDKMFYDLGLLESPMHANAYEATWKLDITASEEELLKNMRKTTRYLIHQSEKNQDISIEKSERLEDIEIYQKLNEKVAKRQKFAPFSSKYIKNEFEAFPGQALWIFGKYKGEVVAGALVIFWSNIGFYHQAASDSKYAKLSIPYLLQWEAIKEAKKRGCVLYDFWGFTDPKKYPKHPWAGPTLFKMGFGGQAYEYVKTQDLPLSKRYWLTYVFEKLRKIKRGL
jgi:lipid II:glycine glycyltransferase (peptidoglycan interpeptide bridge formation enzyme)